MRTNVAVTDFDMKPQHDSPSDIYQHMTPAQPQLLTITNNNQIRLHSGMWEVGPTEGENGAALNDYDQCFPRENKTVLHRIPNIFKRNHHHSPGNDDR